MALAEELSERYRVPVLAVNCLDLGEDTIRDVLSKLLYQFPMKEISFEMPRWINQLAPNHWLKKAVFDQIKLSAESVSRIHQINALSEQIAACEYVDFASLRQMDLGTGTANLSVALLPQLFFQVVSEQTGLEQIGRAHV